jgi:hypothetical protein
MTLPSSYYKLTTYNNRNAIIFYNGVEANDVLTVSIRLGDIIVINGEKIRFSRVDILNNTLSGLTRGVLGTSPADVHVTYDTVYGLTPNRRLDDKYYNVTWNTSVYNTAGDPLQISDTEVVRFLKNGYY